MANRGAKGGKKAAKTYERPGLSDEEIEEIKEAFNLFDTDGSGMFFVELIHSYNIIYLEPMAYNNGLFHSHAELY